MLALSSNAFAQPAGIGALSQSQTLSDSQKQDVSAWLNANADGLLSDDPAQVATASQDLMAPFQRSNVTAAFRFQLQDALVPRLKSDLNDAAPPAARFAALRLCGRIGTSKVLPTLFETAQSDDSHERSLAVAAFADFFATVRETSSPIRDKSVDDALELLEQGLAAEDEPSIASQFVVVLASTGAPESGLRLRASGAMARGLAARLASGPPNDKQRDWAVTLAHAIENVNKTFVQVSLGGQQIDQSFIDAVNELCDETVGFVDGGDPETDDAALLEDLRARAVAVKQRVSG